MGSVIGATGTRTKLTRVQESECFKLLKHLIVYEGFDELHHGDCVGADKYVHDTALFHELKIVVHPSTSSRWRAFCKALHSTDKVEILEPADYLVRDFAIAMACDILIALPKSNEEEVRSGTWATIRYAKRLVKPTIIIFPDGTKEYINYKGEIDTHVSI